MLSLKANLYIVAMFLIFSVGYASSQTMTSGTVVGTVTDSTGAAIPGATVTITQPSTGTVRTTKTNESGQYRFPFLMPSEYVVSAEATGQRTNGTRFTLLIGQEQPVNIVMKVQSLSQTVEVNASAVLLQTENANEDTYIGQKEVSNMPINGGDITNIAFSTPGLRVNVGGGNTNFNVSGLPFSSVLFTINGADIVEPYNLNNKSGASNNTLGANDVAEAAVIVDAFSAQYGREAGAQVNYITKSGTNRVHGNLVENYNDAIMNANDYFNNATGTPRGRSVANQYAASIGGPILRNKLVFFANTEGLRYALPSSGTVSLPSPLFQAYTLANIPTASVPLYQQFFTLINASPGISRAVAVTTGTGNLQDSTGNLGCGTQTFGTPGSGPGFGKTGGVPCAVAFGTNASSINTETYIDGRIDYNINDKQKIYYRMSRDAGVQSTATSPVDPVFNQYSVQPWVIGQLNYTYVITPNVVNNFVASQNWYSAIFGVNNFSQTQSLFPAGFLVDDGGANGGGFNTIGPQPSAGTYSAFGSALPDGRRGQQLQLIDDLSWTLGRHTLQVGVSDRNNRITDSSIAGGSIVPDYTFKNLSDFATGIINNNVQTGSSLTQSFPFLPAVHTRLNSLDYYAQDEWKMLKNLNVTYGLRFEYQGNPSCKENCFSQFNTQFLSSGYQAGITVPYDTTIQTGLHKTFKNLEGTVIEPRLGIAYSPRGAGNMVIRGGIGLFANTFPGSYAASVFKNTPNDFTPTVTTGQVGLAATDSASSQEIAVLSDQAFQTGFTAGYTLPELQTATNGLFATPIFYSNPNDFKTIEVLEWSLEIQQPLSQHDILVITYSGNHGFNEPLSNTDANAYIGTPSAYPNGFGSLPTARPDARFSTVTEILTSGYSNYNGLIAQVRHAFHYGFQGQVSYTWSHALSLGNAASPAALYNPYNLRANYAPTNFDTRDNLTADLLWTSPKLGRHIMQATVGGWTLGGKMYLYSGRPFSVVNSQIAGSLSSTFAGPVLADVLNPSIIGKHCSGSAVQTPCFTAADFAVKSTAANPTGQDDFGNTRPNEFTGPGFFSISSQLAKTIPVTASTSFQLGAQAYNLLNHPNFAVPGSNVTTGSIGKITSDVSVPTSIYGTGQGAIVSGRVLVVFGKFIF